MPYVVTLRFPRGSGSSSARRHLGRGQGVTKADAVLMKKSAAGASSHDVDLGLVRLSTRKPSDSRQSRGQRPVPRVIYLSPDCYVIAMWLLCDCCVIAIGLLCDYYVITIQQRCSSSDLLEPIPHTTQPDAAQASSPVRHTTKPLISRDHMYLRAAHVGVNDWARVWMP